MLKIRIGSNDIHNYLKPQHSLTHTSSGNNIITNYHSSALKIIT